MIKGIIYCYKSPSDGYYIGQTIHERRRKTDHKHAAEVGSMLPFHQAIRKYGWDNFEYTILKTLETETKEELKPLLDQEEINYIRIYKEGGKKLYNATSGGRGTAGRTVSKEECENISKRMKEYYTTEKGKTRLKKYSHPILQYDLEGNFIKEYPSLGSVKFIKDTALCDCLAGRKHSVGNSLWILKEENMDIEETGKKLYERYMSETSRRVIMQKPILQIDKSTNNIIREYNSPKEATLETKISHIRECLTGKRKTAGGFIWSYKDKYNNKNFRI